MVSYLQYPSICRTHQLIDPNSVFNASPGGHQKAYVQAAGEEEEAKCMMLDASS